MGLLAFPVVGIGSMGAGRPARPPQTTGTDTPRMTASRWTADQILASSATRRSLLQPEVPRYNPKPAGVLRPGSATAQVLALLRERPDRWLTFRAILAATGQTHRAASWACLYLRAVGLVEVTDDGARNGRYLRYRAAPPGADAQTVAAAARAARAARE